VTQWCEEAYVTDIIYYTRRVGARHHFDILLGYFLSPRPYLAPGEILFLRRALKS